MKNIKLLNLKCLFGFHTWEFYMLFFNESKKFYSCTVKCSRCLKENTQLYEYEEEEEGFSKGAKKV